MSHSLEQNESEQKTILLAEDFEENAFLLKRLLEMEGYRVFVAVNGREAVEKALEVKPDLIILDVSMPVMTGLEACAILKRDEKTHSIPIIFISAHEEKRFKDEALSLGALHYFTKPVDIEEIYQSIADALKSQRIEKVDSRAVRAPGPAAKRRSKDPYRLTGTLLNEKYELIEYAGGGGMGAVYRARRKVEGDIVAVKILKPDVVVRSPEYAELFEREAKNVRSLDHPHIVKIFDSDKEDELSYLVMEWVEGNSLEDVITQGQLQIHRIINIFEQVCGAIASAHRQGIIHLDLKPSNILLVEDAKPDDVVKVIDFGLSRVISKESGTTVTKFRGTYQYCAPEQFNGKVSHRSDIYSLGATLYHLLTGVIPFGGSYINAKIYPNLELPEIPSVTRQRDLPPAIDNVIKKALYKNPALRQQSATELFEEFRDAMSSDSSSIQGSKIVTESPNEHSPQDIPRIKISTEVDAQGIKILSHAIGIETLGGVFTKLIPEGTPLPCQTSEIFTTATDNQTSVEIHVLAGLRPLAQQNLSLGKFHLIDIPPAPRGVPQIKVAFEVNTHGILQVSARNMNTGREQRIAITSLSGPSTEQIREIFREAKTSSATDTQKRDGIGESNSPKLIDFVSRALRAASVYPVAEELLQQLRELEAAIKSASKGDQVGSSMSEELNHLQGEINGLYKLSGNDIASQMVLRDAQTLLFNLLETPNTEEAGAPQVGHEDPDEDSELSFVLEAAREVKITNRQRQWRTSEEGVASARQEVGAIYEFLERRVKKANEKLAADGAPINIELIRENDDHFILSSGPYNLSVTWNCKSNNTLEDSVLSIRGYKKDVENGQYYTAEYEIELNRDFAVVWRRREQRDRVISTAILAKEIFEYLISHIRNQAMYSK